MTDGFKRRQVRTAGTSVHIVLRELVLAAGLYLASVGASWWAPQADVWDELIWQPDVVSRGGEAVGGVRAKGRLLAISRLSLRREPAAQCGRVSGTVTGRTNGFRDVVYLTTAPPGSVTSPVRLSFFTCEEQESGVVCGVSVRLKDGRVCMRVCSVVSAGRAGRRHRPFWCPLYCHLDPERWHDLGAYHAFTLAFLFLICILETLILRITSFCF